MKIQEQDLFYGAAIHQIVEHSNSVTISKLSDHNSLFVIDHCVRLMLKYRTNARAPWRFTISEREETAIDEALSQQEPFFLGLICANKTVCLLSAADLQYLFTTEPAGDKWISINSGHAKSLWVSGPGGQLPNSIRHVDFPRRLFEKSIERI